MNAAFTSYPSGAGLGNDLYTALNVTSGARVGSLRSVVQDEGATAGTNSGAFIAEFPRNIGGDPDLLKRVIDMKIGYELVGASAPTIVVKTSDGFATMGTEASLAAGSAGQLLDGRVRPSTDATTSPAGYLGRSVRTFQVRLEGSGTPSTLRIHQAEFTTRVGGSRS
jgi:hypothetical protein